MLNVRYYGGIQFWISFWKLFVGTLGYHHALCTCSGYEVSAARSTDAYNDHKSTNLTLSSSHLHTLMFFLAAMSSNTSIPNYWETTFEYTDLTTIHGKPTYDSLAILLNQPKANSQSVQTLLGGGQHGYLDLLLSPTQNAIIVLNTPFIYPSHPGPLNLPTYQLPHVTQQLTAQHAENVRVFHKCCHLEQVLQK